MSMLIAPVEARFGRPFALTKADSKVTDCVTLLIWIPAVTAINLDRDKARLVRQMSDESLIQDVYSELEGPRREAKDAPLTPDP